MIETCARCVNRQGRRKMLSSNMYRTGKRTSHLRFPQVTYNFIDIHDSNLLCEIQSYVDGA